MKKYIIALMALGLAFFTACSQQESAAEATAEDAVNATEEMAEKSAEAVEEAAEEVKEATEDAM